MIIYRKKGERLYTAVEPNTDSMYHPIIANVSGGYLVSQLVHPATKIKPPFSQTYFIDQEHVEELKTNLTPKKEGK